MSKETKPIVSYGKSFDKLDIYPDTGAIKAKLGSKLF